MMTTKQRIISCLETHPEGLDDDQLTKILGISRRQQVNMRCRDLENEGLVTRHRVNGKINNFLTGKPIVPRAPSSPSFQNITSDHELWFWEGNIQSKVIMYLAWLNFQIRSVADTASRQQGIDIVAEKNGT